MTSVKQDCVVVTGFGLFCEHQANPSWDSIKDGRLQVDRPNIKLVTKQINVEYRAVDEQVKELWRLHEPILMVHVGLAAMTKNIRLERRARHGPYIRDDVAQFAPHKQLEVIGDRSGQEEQVKSLTQCASFECSRTCVDIDRLCERLNKLYESSQAPLKFECSNEAGLYVCEYIYQKSLRICDRTVFIHVPDTSDEISLEDIGKCLKLAIETTLDELNAI